MWACGGGGYGGGSSAGRYPVYIRHLCLQSVGQHLSASLPHNKAIKWAGPLARTAVGPWVLEKYSARLAAYWMLGFITSTWNGLGRMFHCPTPVYLMSRDEPSKTKCTAFGTQVRRCPCNIFLFFMSTYILYWSLKEEGKMQSQTVVRFKGSAEAWSLWQIK